MLNIFSWACWPSEFPLGSFFNQVVWFLILSCLFILEINLLLVRSFANIFSQSLGFHFVYGFLAIQKLFSLIRSDLFIFVFISLTLEDRSKNIAAIYLKLCSVFSSRSFRVSCLTLRSFIYFEFIFLYGARECSNFILSHVAVQFFQHHLLKRLPFLHCIFLPPFP